MDLHFMNAVKRFQLKRERPGCSEVGKKVVTQPSSLGNPVTPPPQPTHHHHLQGRTLDVSMHCLYKKNSHSHFTITFQVGFKTTFRYLILFTLKTPICKTSHNLFSNQTFNHRCSLEDKKIRCGCYSRSLGVERTKPSTRLIRSYHPVTSNHYYALLAHKLTLVSAGIQNCLT